MTAIKGVVGVTKRADGLGVHSMDCFSMTVPDLTAAEIFFTAFGLEMRSEGAGAGLYTRGGSHRWAALEEGKRKRLEHLSFAVFEEDFEAMKRHIEGQKVKLLSPPAGIDGNGIWFRDPFGTLIEVTVAEKTTPNVKSDFTTKSGPAGKAAAPVRSQATRVHPTRLAHILLFTPDVLESMRFYCETLGLRLSDRAGDGVCFLHGIHGSDHHLLAFAKSNGPGVHHTSWDVGGIDEIGRGATYMADQGFNKGWGLGRHVLGSNYFHYVGDPWGSYAEYSADIDYIPLTQNWPGADNDPADSFYLWGPELPDGFIHNFEADPD